MLFQKVSVQCKRAKKPLKKLIKYLNKECFKYEFSIVLKRTGIIELDNKTFYKNFRVPKEQINKVFKDQYIFGTTKKTNLLHLDYLEQVFKHQIIDKIENEYVLKDFAPSVFIDKQIVFEDWLKGAKITIKEI